MHALISGAGVAGLTIARSLARAGWSVDVVERAPAPRSSGYLIDFFGAGFDAADRLGLLPSLRERAESYAELRSVDADGRVRARLPIDLVSAAVGGRYMTILRPQIVEALHAGLPDSVRIRWGTQIASLEDDGELVRVELEDGDRLDMHLVIGADGIGSRVRELAWGPRGDYVRPVADLIAIAWIGSDARLAADLGDHVAMQTEVRRQLVVAPLESDGVTGFAMLRGVDETQAIDAVARMGVLGRRAAPAIVEPYLDRVEQSIVPSWSRGRVVLLGDAGVAVSLLAGQGASLAVAGAEQLAAALTSVSEPSGIPAALDDFERAWRPTAEREQARGRSTASTFAPATAIEVGIQRLVWRAAGLPGVARLVAKAAGGVTKGR